MKVSVYPAKDGKQDVLVQASVGSGKPPVLIRGLTKENFRSEVLPVVIGQRRDVPGQVSIAGF